MGTDIDAKQVVERADELFSQAAPWRDTWAQIADYMLPGRRSFSGVVTPGQRGTQKLHDGTAIAAGHLLAASIHGSVSSPDAYWCYLRAQDDGINDLQPCGVWLDDTTRRMHWHFQQSNLYAEIGESYLDDVLFGTSDLYLTEKDPARPQFSGYRFRTFPCGQFVIDENADGLVDTLYLPALEYSARAVAQRWPDTCSRQTRETAAVRPTEKVQVVYGVWPRPGGKSGGFARNLPWAACYIERDSLTVLEESGHEEMPHLVSRWSKGPGEAYGRSPGWFALPDTKSLNLAKGLELTAWEMAIHPPYKRLEHGVIGRVRLTPGGETLVQDMDDIQPIVAVKPDWQASQVKAESIARGIRELFFRDQLELVESDRMTATEVEQRVQLMQRFLGPTLGRMTSEKLAPLIQRAFLMLYRRRALLPPPPEMVDYIRSGGALQIRYEGPLARAQRLSELQAVQRALNTMGPMVQFDQRAAAMFDNCDWDGIADIVLDATGVAMRGRKDPRQRDRDRQALAQQMAQRAQLEAAGQIAEGMGKAAPMVQALQPQAREAA